LPRRWPQARLVVDIRVRHADHDIARGEIIERQLFEARDDLLVFLVNPEGFERGHDD